MSNDDSDDGNVIKMPNRGSQEPEKTEVGRYTDQLTPSLSLTVEGTTFTGMIARAKSRAAGLLLEPVEHLYVMRHGSMNVHSQSRFEDPERPTSWAMNVVIGIIPESARQPEPEPPPKPKGRSAPRKTATRKPKL